MDFNIWYHYLIMNNGLAKSTGLRTEINHLKDELRTIQEAALVGNGTASQRQSKGSDNVKALIKSYERSIASLKQELSKSRRQVDSQQQAISELHFDKMNDGKSKINVSTELAIKKLINNYKEEVTHLKEDLLHAKVTIMKQQYNISVIKAKNKEILSNSGNVKVQKPVSEGGKNVPDKDKTELISSDLSLPSIDKFLPHLANNPDALKPGSKDSKGKTGGIR